MGRVPLHLLLLAVLPVAACATVDNANCPVSPGAGHGFSRKETNMNGSTTMTQLVQRRVTGATLVNVDGRQRLFLRGPSSISRSSEPLVILDGSPLAQRGVAALETINPNNVATVEALRDVASLTRYGADGGGGVLLIRSRRGGCD